MEESIVFTFPYQVNESHNINSRSRNLRAALEKYFWFHFVFSISIAQNYGLKRGTVPKIALFLFNKNRQVTYAQKRLGLEIGNRLPLNEITNNKTY